MGSSDFIYAPRLEINDPNAEAFYGQLLRGTTHKLNNLLAVIHGFSSLIMMNDELEASEVENLKHMKEAAHNASVLSERILTVGGCATVNIQEVVTSEFINMIDTNIREPFEKSGVPIEINIADDFPHISTDGSRLKDVILELLKNASDSAAVTGGSASISIKPSGTFGPADPKRIDIIIENTGETVEDVMQLFEPFHSTRDSNHFGIGLTSAAVLCGQLDIPLAVRSVDGTTTFWLSVPTTA